MNIKYFPIVVFSFNRPDHLNNLIKSIKESKNFYKFKYYFFCDGAKTNISESERIKIKENINLIKKFDVKKKIILRKKNYGLSKNIISGLDSILLKYDAAIILEDDLVINKNCLEFMNFSLNKFKKDKKVGSITGYSYIHNINKYKNLNWFKSFRHCSWSWATWKRVWKNIDWQESKKKYIKENYKKYDNILKKAGHDIPFLLRGQNMGLIDSWAVRFNYFCLINNLCSISPRFSLTRNDGFGFNATHTHNIFKIDKILFNEKKFLLKNLKKPKFYSSINNIIKSKHKPSIKLKLKMMIKNL